MSASFQDALNLILRDEAKHHGSGLVLTQAVTVTAEMKDEMFEYTRQFVMATQGANWAMQALEAVRGELSNVHKQQFLEETNYLQLQQQRKLKLMEMIQKSDRFGITERLVKEGV